MRTVQPNFKLVLSDISEKFSSVITSVITGRNRKQPPSDVKRVIRWFEKNGDNLVGEVPLDKVDLPVLQRLFDIADDNPMYDCYPIKTESQIKYIQKATHLPIEPWSYDYFLECDAL